MPFFSGISDFSLVASLQVPKLASDMSCHNCYLPGRECIHPKNAFRNPVSDYLNLSSKISTIVFSVATIPGDAISPMLRIVSSGVAPLIP